MLPNYKARITHALYTQSTCADVSTGAAAMSDFRPDVSSVVRWSALPKS